MAVVERLRAKGRKVYGVSNEWQGKPVWELIGPSRRAAETRDREMKREIKAGTFVPKESMKALTVLQYCDVWVSARSNASADEERSIIRRYIEPVEALAGMLVADVKPRHVLSWVQHWQTQRKPDGSRLISDKTIANAVGVLRMMFEAALLRELCSMQPVQLPRKTLKRAVVHEKEIYTLAECVVLIRHHSIPWPIRVMNALCLLTGMREGEVCGRRWRDIDAEAKPLACISVHDQYEGRPLKTERPRLVPIHPELHRILMAWAQEGFELYTGVKPTADDYIVPNVSPRAKVRNHTESSFYKQFIKHAEAAGVRPRSLHATRHSFITHCRRGGARADVLERVTHNAVGKMIDRYTHWEWEPVCAAVLCLNLDAHRDLQPPPKTTVENGGSNSFTSHGQSRVLPSLALSVTGSIPAASNNAIRTPLRNAEEVQSLKATRSPNVESPYFRAFLRQGDGTCQAAKREHRHFGPLAQKLVQLLSRRQVRRVVSRRRRVHLPAAGGGTGGRQRFLDVAGRARLHLGGCHHAQGLSHPVNYPRRSVEITRKCSASGTYVPARTFRSGSRRSGVFQGLTAGFSHHVLNDETATGWGYLRQSPFTVRESKAGEGGASTVIEFDLDEGKEVWRHESTSYTQQFGGAQRLPGGNTLITYSNEGVIQEVSRSGDIALSVNATPFLGYSTWSLYGSR